MLQQLQAVQFPSSLPQNPQYSQAPLPQPQGQGMFLRNSNSSSNSGGNGGGGGGPPTAAAVQPRVEIVRDGIDKKRFYTKDTKSESQAHLLVKIHGYGNVQATSVSFDAYAVRLDDTPISKDRKEKKIYVKVIESRFVESDSWLIDVKMTEGTLKSLAKFYIIATLTLVDGRKLELRSNPSNAFITITNANQKKHAQQIFCHYSFFRQSKDGLSAVSREDFTQNLGDYFSTHINKDPQGNVRKLVPYETESLMMRFFPGMAQIEPGQHFTDFFHWLDGTIAGLQAPGQRALLEYGFVFVAVVDPLLEFILQRQQVGTFLIRCSESTPGKLSIVYKSGEKSFGKLWLGSDLSPASLANAVSVASMLTKIARIDTQTLDVVIFNKEYVIRGFCTRNDNTSNTGAAAATAAEQDGIPRAYSGSL